METKLVLLLAMAVTAYAGPITLQESDKCATKCTKPTKFNYSPRTTQIYDYRVDYETHMAGASEDKAKLTLTTTANIEVLSECEFGLRLTGTRLSHSNANGQLIPSSGEQEFRRALDATTLRFSFQDGVVEHVCAGGDDPAWVLNIKKGILSAFQNSMDDLTQPQNVTESDISGACNTEYKVVSNGYYTTTVTKSKNILTCSDRHSLKTILRAVPYDLPSDVQTAPLMKTTHECSQDIQVGGVLKSSKCTELHLYRPFSYKTSGGLTKVTQVLTHKTYTNGISSSATPVSQKQSLAFDHSSLQENSENMRMSVEKKLKEICDVTSYDIPRETPRLFSELVALLKSLHTRDIEAIHTLLKSKSLCPSNGRTYKFFLDALPVVNTDGSVRLMAKLIKDKEVDGILAEAWISSLAFINRPTSGMILEAKSLIDNKATKLSAVLPVSSMVNNYCKMTSSCAKDDSVLSVVASLEQSMGRYCKVNKKNRNEILLALRAIGNIGNVEKATSMLNMCIRNSDILEVQVSAVDAFRRMPCDADDKQLWKALQDESNDSELRINAYLALIRCTDELTLKKIAKILSKETDEQVGSFITSHLNNLRDTSDPLKQDIARAIRQMTLEKEFDTNPLKFSRNFEASLLLNKINTGLTAEANLLWSNKAQLPRSMWSNLTVELFGEAVQLMEIGGRLEGLEYLIKNVFQPFLNGDGKKAAPISSDDVNGAIYGRAFGNELFFLHSTRMNGMKMPFSWLEMLIKLSKKNEASYTQTINFLDTSLNVPTTAGLPIHIDVNGTAILDVYLNGKADVRKLGSAPRSMDVDGEIRPSAAIEITGTMSIDAFVTKTGLRMRNTIHTSTSLKGRMSIERGQVMVMQLDTPEDKMEIFDARSEFYIVHNNVEQKQKMITDNRKEFKVCTGDKLATITGMELCGEVQFPNASMHDDSPMFPLTGPTSASIVLTKTDTHSGYMFLAKALNNKKNLDVQISFNTPSSKIDRALGLDLTLNHKKQEASMQLASPWKTATFKGSMVNDNDMKSLSGNLLIDHKINYGLTSEMKISKSKGKVQFNPLVELRRPGAKNVKLSGFVSVEKPLKGIDMNIIVSGASNKPYNFKSTYSNTKKGLGLAGSLGAEGEKPYTFDGSSSLAMGGKKILSFNSENLLKIATPKKTLADISASAEYKENKMLKLKAVADVDSLMRKPASFEFTGNKAVKKNGGRINIKSILKSSAISGSIKNNLRMVSGRITNTGDFSYSIPKYSNNKIRYSTKFNDRSTAATKSYTVKSNMKVKKNPEYNADVSMNLIHKRKHSEAGMLLKYGKNMKDINKQIALSGKLSRKQFALKNADVNYDIKISAPGHNVDVQLDGSHMHKARKALNSNVHLGYGKKDVNLELNLRDQSANRMKYTGKALASWPGANYHFNTDLTQTSGKQYKHTLLFKDNDGKKHDITTVYKTASPKSHEFSTKIDVLTFKPIVLSGTANNQRNKYVLGGEVQHGQDKYGVRTTTKVTDSPSAKIDVEVYCPSRRMTLAVDGGKVKSRYDGSIEASWDADNKDSRISLDGSLHKKSHKDTVSMGANLGLKTPFSGFENLQTSIKYGSDETQQDLNGKFTWGKKQTVDTSINVKNPLSLSNAQIACKVKTPFKGFSNMEAELDHKLNKGLNTVLRGKLQKENIKLTIQGADNSKKNSLNVKGNVNMKSTIKNLESVTASFAHNIGDNRMKSVSSVDLNGKKYSYDLSASHARNGWQIKNNGDLILMTPKDRISHSWKHSNGDKDLKTSLVSKWNKDVVSLNMKGAYNTGDMSTLSGVVNVNTPWKGYRDIDIMLNHKNARGLINSKVEYKNNKNVRASTSMGYTRNNNAVDFNFDMKSPFNNDIVGKMNVNYDAHPLTGSAELKWAPRKKATIEGSINIPSFDNADLNIKMTSPIISLRNVVLKVSNKKESDEMVSRANLDFGMRHEFDVEARHTLSDSLKNLRLKLQTPYEQLKSFETGMRFDGEMSDFNTAADFELTPIVGKYEGSMTWKYNKDLSGKLRIDTPIAIFPYLELSTTSKMVGGERKSSVGAEYYPGIMHSIDVAYSFDLPLTFDAKLNTPYPQYNGIGMSFKHSHTDSSVNSNAVVKYQPEKQIEGDLNAAWEPQITGALLVKTPFEGYELSSLTLNHRSDKKSFVSHGDVFVANQKVAADIMVRSGYKSSGTFSFSSPLPYLENIEVNVQKKGNLDNVRGSGIIDINGQRMETNFMQKMSDDMYKSSVFVNTPFTKQVRASIDHDGSLSNFNNKVSMSYGNKYELDTNVNLDNRDALRGDGSIKYKIDNKRNTVSASFMHSGSLENMQFKGDAGFNRDKIELDAHLKQTNGLDASLQVKSPFDGFNNIGVSMDHSGDLSNFQTNAKINYMDKKNIIGKITLASNGLKMVQLSSELKTPFMNFEKTAIELQHSADDEIQGNAKLETTINSFGNGIVTYSKRGSLNNLNIEGEVEHNSEILLNMKASNSHQQGSTESKIDIKGSLLPETSVSFSRMGDWSQFNTNAKASVGRHFVSGDASLTQGYDSINADAGIEYRLGALGRNTGSLSLAKSGDINNLNAEITGKFGKDTVKATASKKGSIEDMTVLTSVSANKASVKLIGDVKTTDGFDGSLNLITPFDNFRDIGMKLTHKGKPTDFKSSADLTYMDGQNIAGNARVTIDGSRYLSVVSDIKTPFALMKNAEMKINHNWNTNSLSGDHELTLATDTYNLKYNKDGTLNDHDITATVKKNQRQQSSLSVSNKVSSNKIISTVDFQSIVTPRISLSLNHNGNLEKFSTKATCKTGNNNIEGELNMNQNINNVDLDGKVNYEIESLGKDTASFVFHKEGDFSDIKATLTGKLGSQESTIEGKYNSNNGYEGSVDIKSPFTGYRDIGASFKHSGVPNNFNSEAIMKLADGEMYSAKFNFFKYNLERVEAIAEIKTPLSGYEATKFEYRHEGESNAFKCYSVLEYGQNKKIIYDMQAANTDKPQITVTLKTPFKGYNELMYFSTYEIASPTSNFETRINAGKGRIVKMTGVSSLDDASLSGSLDIETPVKGYKNVGMTYLVSGNNRNFNVEASMTYKEGKVISGKVSSQRFGRSLTAELKTPFKGFKTTKYTHKHQWNNNDGTIECAFVYGGNKKVEMDIAFEMEPTLKSSIAFKTPFQGFEEVGASIESDYTGPKYDLIGKLNAGTSRQFVLDGSLDLSDDISGSIALNTPFKNFNDVGITFSHNGNAQKFSTEGKVTYMDGQDISSKVTFYRYMWRRLVATAELQTPFNDMKKTKAEVNFEDNQSSLSTSAALEYGDDRKMNGNLKVTYSPKYDVVLTLNSPFEQYRLIRAQGSLDTSAPTYAASYNIMCGNNKPFAANAQLTIASPQDVDASLEVNVPMPGFEMTKLQYKHVLDDKKLEGMASVLCGNGRKSSIDLTSNFDQIFDTTVDVVTPFEGYENMQASASFDPSYKKYDVSGKLDLGQGSVFSAKSGLDYSSEPIRVSAGIVTPFDDFKNVDMTATHEGSLNDFKTTVTFSCPLTQDVNAKANIKVDSIHHIDAEISLQSVLPGMDDLRVELKNSDVAGEKKSHATVGWTSGKEINLEGLYRFKNTWYEDKTHVDISLRTPFEIVQSLSGQFDHANKQDGVSVSSAVQMNGDDCLDMDASYTKKDKEEGVVTIRKPWPMEFSANKASDAGVTDMEVILNWNRNEPSSRVKLLTTLTDKSDDQHIENGININVEHISRTVGLSHEITSSSHNTVSKGKLSWDDNSQVFYDLQLSDNSRRRRQMKDASFKLGLPSRTLALTGAFSDNKVVALTDATFNWDADRDDTKKVGVKATVTRGDQVKGDVTLSMPSIGKEINVNGEVQLNNGRVLLDAKTDISYSPDSRKTLTLSSRLEDIAGYNSKYNYSLALGVQHPYTNVDVRMKSHVGSSDKLVSMGIESIYLTARRESKHMMLRAEIDKLKKQINVLSSNPISKTEITGDIISSSPLKMRILTKTDDEESFRGDVTIDSEKKSLLLNTYMDDDQLTLSALYPNPANFRVDVERHGSFVDQKEALLNARLNTSRLLHTRLSWRPEVMSELRSFVTESAISRGAKAALLMGSINEAIAQEITAKYAAISDHVADEADVLVRIMHREMADLAILLRKISKEMQTMYNNNDFYIQDLGSEANTVYMAAQEKITELNSAYVQKYSELVRSMRSSVENIRSYPMRAQYDKAVGATIYWFAQQMSRTINSIDSSISDLDKVIQEYKAHVVNMKQNFKNAVTNSTYIEYISNKIPNVNVDISPYVSSFEMPSTYSNAIYKVHDLVNSNIFNSQALRPLKSGFNEVYQQGVWAYHYWQTEENIRKHAHHILENIKGILLEELKEYAEGLRMLYKNPITVWQPENGEIQAELILPVDVKRLDEVPDMSPLVERMNEIVDRYTPDKSTVDQWTNNVRSYVSQYSDNEGSERKAKRRYKNKKRASRKAKSI